MQRVIRSMVVLLLLASTLAVLPAGANGASAAPMATAGAAGGSYLYRSLV